MQFIIIQGQNLFIQFLINNLELPRNVSELYLEEQAEPVIFDIENLKDINLNIYKEEIALVKDGVVRHHAGNVAKWLCNYVKQKDIEAISQQRTLL